MPIHAYLIPKGAYVWINGHLSNVCPWARCAVMTNTSKIGTRASEKVIGMKVKVHKLYTKKREETNEAKEGK